MGRGGLYFRTTLPSGSHRPPNAPSALPAVPPSADGLEEIESGSTLRMIDSSSAALLAEINSKAKRIRLWPLATVVSVTFLGGLAALRAPTWVLCVLALFCCGGIYFAALQDRLRKTVVLFYEMEPQFEEAYQRLHNAFEQIRMCHRRWHVEAQGGVHNLHEWKTHAGATSLVRRKSVTFELGAPPYFRTNVTIPVIPAGRQTLYFFPDRLLVYAPEGVGAVAYDALDLATEREKFIESDGVPGDAQVVGSTWRYVNKSGGPDKRYNDNREIPIALYEAVQLTSGSGLREYFQLSKVGVATEFKESLRHLASVLTVRAAALQSGFITCPCNNCSGHIEFPADNVGQVVKCPHCGLETTLFKAAVPQPPNSPSLPVDVRDKEAPANGYDPSELLKVCDSILEDGEISGDEAYTLSNWLNEHREASFHWPGDSLVPLLQQIWEDGKVTKTELRQLARALVRIRKESVKRQSQRAANEAIAAAKQAFRSFDLSQPVVPLLPYAAEIKSHSERGVRYHVDLSFPSCTCPDFMTRRQSLPVGHINRCCKHVFDAYRQLVTVEDCRGWMRGFIENGWPAHPDSEWSVVPVDGSYILASTAPNGWSNIYAINGHEYGRFGYNLAEERWAYGEAPGHADEIVSVVHQICRV
jgi:hypothetical protein